MVIQVEQRVWNACPNCCCDLLVRSEYIGREVECRHCGHRFRPQPVGSSDSEFDGSALLVPESSGEIHAFSGDHRMWTLECSTGAASINLVAELDRLRRERDQSQAGCARLQNEVQELGTKLDARSAEAARLRKSAARLLPFRGECDRLYAEQAVMSRDAARQESRLVEIQVTLVEVEAQLDELRERSEAERRSRLEEQAIHRRVAREAELLQDKVKRLRRHGARVRQQRDQALRQVESLGQTVDRLNERCARLSAYLDDAETENRVAQETHQAETSQLREALNEALDEAESALQRETAHLARIQALQDQLELLRN